MRILQIKWRLLRPVLCLLRKRVRLLKVALFSLTHPLPPQKISGSGVQQEPAAQTPSSKPTQRLTVITSQPKQGFLGVGLQAAGDLDGNGKGDLLVARMFGENEYEQRGLYRHYSLIPGQTFSSTQVDFFGELKKTDLSWRGLNRNGELQTSFIWFNPVLTNSSHPSELLFGVNGALLSPIQKFAPTHLVNSEANLNHSIRFTYTDVSPDFEPVVGFDNIVKGYGESLAFLGDVNGDGLEDYLIGEPKGSSHFYNLPNREQIPNLNQFPDYNYRGGRCHIVFGQKNRLPLFDTSQLNGENGFILVGGLSESQTCENAKTIGDFNGDSFNDFIVAAGSKHILVWGKKIYFAFEPGFSSRQSDNLELDNFAIYTEGILSQDINQDGRMDLLYPSFNFQTKESEIALVYGPDQKLTGTLNMHQPEASGLKVVHIRNFPTGYQVSLRTSFVKDLNQDQIPDIIISDTKFTPEGLVLPNREYGKVYVIFGRKEMPEVIDASQLNGKNGFAVEGQLPHDQLGTAMAATDFDGDGFQDLVMTAPQLADQSHGNGKIYILYGSSAGFGDKIDLNEIESKRDEPLIQHQLREPGARIIEVVEVG